MLPKKIDHELSAKLEIAIEDLLYGTKYWSKFKRLDVDCYITDTDTGRVKSRYGKRTLTVPKWAYESKGKKKGQDDPDYFLYYVAHELSHLFSNHGHRKLFYKAFTQICPNYLQHHEIGYKPSCVRYGVKPK